MEDLHISREKIDDIDGKILKLLEERFKVVWKVAEFKKKNNLSALQSGRWEQVLQNKVENAEKIGVSEDLVRVIWSAIHMEALRQEEKYFS